MIIIGYIILRTQANPILNPNGIGDMGISLSFNTIISFMTNTNLQHYSGESGLSYLSQMAVITFMMFVSAASGYAVCVAFVRDLAGKDKVNMGNFYSDLIRITTWILLPLAIFVALFLVWQGVPQNLSANVIVKTIEGTFQNIAMDPVAALESIKHLGTNGGGFFGANSTTPFENPTIWSNLTELYSMMILPGACVIMFGKMVSRPKTSDKKKFVFFGGEGRTVFTAMTVIFLIGLIVCFSAEMAGNPALAETGLSQSMGSMEGKEVRLGVSQSALFTTVTTSFTTGTVNNMHDTLTPLGGLVPTLHMMLNLVFGGKGVGLMNMVVSIILTIFICGLMIDRTPEYLGKKIEGKEMKLVALCIIVHPLLILGFSALAVSTQAGLAGITNGEFHGLSQVLYEFSSSAANNGSGFEGLADNSTFWNITTGLAMFFGHYASIIMQMAIAGSLMKKQHVHERIPDHIFDESSQVELVDIEPEDLITRLNEGKIYKEAQVQKALSNFFEIKNLAALREIALRRCADKLTIVSEKTKLNPKDSYYTDEHILIGLSSSPSNAKIIRTAARMAQAFRGNFTALFVEASSFSLMSDENKNRLRKNMHLAEQLGAKIETVQGDDIPLQIAEFTRLFSVSKIILGRNNVEKNIIGVSLH